MNLKLTQSQQNAICLFVERTFTDYETKTKEYRDTMEDIYRTVKKFKKTKAKVGQNAKYGEKTHDWETNFIVNKAFEVENKVLPKIIGHVPNRIVTAKPTYKGFQKEEEITPGNVAPATPEEMADMVRDYLTSIYNKQDMVETLELLARNGIRYGQGFVKSDYKYAIGRDKKKEEEEEIDETGNPMIGEDGKPVMKVVSKVVEDINDEYPTIECKSWTDMYFDPRYIRLEDMPGIIEIARNMRISYFTQNQSDYINIDKLVECCRGTTEDVYSYKRRIQSMLGIDIKDADIILPTTLQLKQFYGYYNISEKEDMKDERLYKFRTLNNTILVCAEEISAIPYEDFQVFKDTETYFATGYIEAIISIQEEMNFQKNSAATYVNKVLYPPVIRSPNSGTDPRTLNPGPGAVIITSKSAEEAAANIVQYPFRDLPNSYWSMANDWDRIVQSLTFTINTADPQSGLLDTATGAKINNIENNGVHEGTRKRFENTMVRIAYKLLQYTSEHLENNITIKMIDEDGYREVNKEAFKEAISKYNVMVEAGSSAFDSPDERRNDAIAKWNLALNAAKAGIPVDLKYFFENVMKTFEGVDVTKLFTPVMMGVPGQASQVPGMPNSQQPQAPSTMLTA